MDRFFGTDGVRGLTFTELTVEMAEALGFAAVSILGPRLVIGRDTRASGLVLEQGLIAGITAADGQALLAGIIPTPAVALLVRENLACGGVVISASHNSFEYNGIKFFDAQGFKLTEAQEDQFEAVLQELLAGDQSVIEKTAVTPDTDLTNKTQLEQLQKTQSTEVNQLQNAEQVVLTDSSETYISHAVEIFTIQNYDLRGLKIVVDCAHGAAWYTTPEAFSRLGAEVITINADFNGEDINANCGSTDLNQLRTAVLDYAADLGIAHDGDADRLIAMDANGNEVDGDYIEAICAKYYQEQGKLTSNTVVSTVMANLGFVIAMEELGIEVIRTDVGDSKVLAAMRKGGYALGGEQSGHMLFLEHNTTGDGLVSALMLLLAMRHNNQPLHQLTQIMQKYPQVTINVGVSDKEASMSSTKLAEEIQAVEAELGSNGRVLVRASGTEPKIRVMVEAQSEGLATKSAQRLAELVEELSA